MLAKPRPEWRPVLRGDPDELQRLIGKLFDQRIPRPDGTRVKRGNWKENNHGQLSGELGGIPTAGKPRNGSTQNFREGDVRSEIASSQTNRNHRRYAQAYPD